MRQGNKGYFRFAVFMAVMLFAGCLGSAKKKHLDVTPLAGVGDLEEAFLKYYEPVEEDFEIDMPSYSFPVDVTKATNFNDVKHYLSKAEHLALLKEHGFIVVNGGVVDDITVPYERLLKEEIPIYVTADTPLHLFHIQFDETLKEIEETVFFDDIVAVTRAMLESMDMDYRTYGGDVKEAAKRNVAYFAVAMKQFDPDYEPPGYVADWVEWECEQIEEHEGLPLYEVAREKALFRIPEDYSQYKPRGHYTRSDTLKRYFRGMMWYGRMTFLMKGHEKKFGPIIPPAEALIDRETALIQTIQAVLIAARCGEVRIKDGRMVSDVWNRIYTVTAFYAGFADDLTLYDYREALREVYGNWLNPGDLEKQGKFASLLLELLKRKPPAIFSGTGGAGIDPGGYEGHEFTSVKQLDELLHYTMGFRFMGQRYIPDSYILGQLVSPGAGSIPGKIAPRFTSVEIYDERIQPDLYYTIRGFPRGLDVFSVFGSKRAEEHIADYADHEYPKYAEQVEKLRKEFEALTPEEWNQNLYWAWLYSLKTLVEERTEGYQTYQQTQAWLDRQLTTALASWSALRHNTILYAKQSYTPVFVGVTSVQPIKEPPPPPKGLVEPLPEFYARMLTTVKMAYSGLKELDVLNDRSETRLSSLVRLLERLNDICRRQAANEKLTDVDNEFLADFAEALKNTIGDVDEKGLKTTIIADVHTDLNTKKCLEEASGYVDYLIVAYKRAEGDIVLAVGPVLSYYEFKHPMKDRLTDETWREMLKTGKVPERPEWINTYCIE